MFAKSYAQFYESLNKNKAYREEIKFVYEWAKKPKRILDIGCGPAHYWKYYPKTVEVIGVEKSESMRSMASSEHLILPLDVKNIGKVYIGDDFDLVTALFDVVQYIDDHSWWKTLPLKDGGYFIFDAWDKKKIVKEGFKQTIREFDGYKRIITPNYSGGNRVTLDIKIYEPEFEFLCSQETHEMYLFDEEDICELSGEDFDVTDIKRTKGWRTWYRLKKR